MLYELMHGDVVVASVDLEEVTGVMVRLAEVSDIAHMPVGTVIFEFTGASNVKEIAQLIAANSF